MRQREVHPGEFYRHFKNRYYQVIAVALHSETGEPMVVYQALYGDFQIYVRPYDLFVSEVDHEKYPEVSQRYRFERVYPDHGANGDLGTWKTVGRTDDTAFVENGESVGRDDFAGRTERDPEPNPDLLAFLDADDYASRMECLQRLEKTASQSDIDSICVALDIHVHPGEIWSQIAQIRKNLSLQEHYDGSRLRG